MAPAPTAPLGREIFRRLLLAFALATTIGIGLATWGFLTANKRAETLHQEASRNHYQAAISSLERRWGREANNLRVRLESMRHLEDPASGRDKVLAYLIAQGGNIEFPSLRIDDARGEPLVLYEHAGRRIPEARFAADQNTAWAWDPIQGRLYLVYRQLIWLGKENGHLVMFKPMDNALLTQLAYPDTRLTLWWGDRAFASSEGNPGLDALARGAVGAGTLEVPWPSTSGDPGPRLMVESTARPLMHPLDFVLPMAVGFLSLVAALWVTLGTWGRHILDRLRALERAVEGFLARRTIDADIRRDLTAENQREHDEIAELAVSVERLMDEVSAERAAAAAQSGSRHED
ncbi:MAG: hypothetical protein FIB06_10785 [Betaproteobacteria bacterium]|nr:hypothetical protein [Betaproteobacteria bacterium]